MKIKQRVYRNVGAKMVENTTYLLGYSDKSADGADCRRVLICFMPGAYGCVFYSTPQRRTRKHECKQKIAHISSFIRSFECTQKNLVRGAGNVYLFVNKHKAAVGLCICLFRLCGRNIKQMNTRIEYELDGGCAFNSLNSFPPSMHN